MFEFLRQKVQLLANAFLISSVFASFSNFNETKVPPANSIPKFAFPKAI